MEMHYFWITLMASCLCLPAFAQVYKWVDEKGVTHYGQRPPADNKGQKMNVPNAAPIPIPAPAVGGASSQKAGATLKEQEVEFRRRQIVKVVVCLGRVRCTAHHQLAVARVGVVKSLQRGYVVDGQFDQRVAFDRRNDQPIRWNRAVHD